MILPLIFLFIGIVCGRFFLASGQQSNAEWLVSVSLAVVIFSAGIGIGANKTVLRNLQKYRAKVLLIPLGIVLGSLLAGAGVGVILGMPLGEAMAVAAGFGYYSLSAGLLAELGGANLGALAFTSNMIRELIALAATPLIAKYCGRFAAIAPAGATSMDTALGVISRSTDEEITIISIINGVILTTLVPILVPSLFQMF